VVPEPFTVALVQMRCSDSAEANMDKAITRIREAAAAGAQIVCLPELFRGPYFCQREDPALFDLAEPIPGPTTQRLGQVAKAANIVIVASIFERRGPGVHHNTAAIIDSDGQLLGIYRKMHIPDDPLYYEKFYFTPGDLGYRAFDTNAGRVGALEDRLGPFYVAAEETSAGADRAPGARPTPRTGCASGNPPTSARRPRADRPARARCQTAVPSPQAPRADERTRAPNPAAARA
jgi:hypothetical protein